MLNAKRNIFVLLFILFCAQFAFFASLSPAHAGKLWSDQVGMEEIGQEAFQQTSNSPTDVRVVIARIIKVFLSFLGIIFLVLFLWAGFRWMTSAGNEKNIEDAKAQMRNAVIGFLIIMMSYAVTAYVMACIFDVTTASSVWMCSF